jgi:hypothetical protein
MRAWLLRLQSRLLHSVGYGFPLAYSSVHGMGDGIGHAGYTASGFTLQAGRPATLILGGDIHIAPGCVKLCAHLNPLFIREESWPKKRNARTQHVPVRRNPTASTAAHHARARARQLRLIAIAGIPSVRAISDSAKSGVVTRQVSLPMHCDQVGEFVGHW